MKDPKYLTELFRRELKAAKLTAPNLTEDNITVLSKITDPYQCGIPGKIQDAAWVAEKLEGSKVRHIRGLHYSILGMIKPDGTAYTNTKEDYDWLSHVVTQGTWQGVIPFESLDDNRASPPTIYRPEIEKPYSYIFHGNSWRLDALRETSPMPHPVGSISAKQRYILAIFGEKSSLGNELRPVAERYGADLYLATGELSVTQSHLMARDAANDGRELVLFTVADFDPSGYQMPVSITRKLRGLRDLEFPEFKYRVVPVALTLEQCKAYDLPSEPLKKGEARKAKWREAMGGRDQTEVDALLGRFPGALADIVSEAIEPYHDTTLVKAAREATTTWHAEAQAAIDAVVTDETKVELKRRYDEAYATIAAIDKDLEKLCDDVALPPLPELPDEAAVVEIDDTVLATTEWNLVRESLALKARKKYEGT